MQFSSCNGINRQIIFSLNQEFFGINILNIQEIIRYVEPVKVPKSPDFIAGVFNFRGEIIPLFDLRKIFGMSETVCDEFTVIAVVETEGKIFGLLMDRVSDIISYSGEQIQPVPEFNHHNRRKYLKSIGTTEDKIAFILDLPKLVDFDVDEELVNQ